MNKQKDKIRKESLLTIEGETEAEVKSALVCDLFILTLFLWDQLRYGMNMLALIIPLALIGVYLLINCVLHEEYCFLPDSLVILHRLENRTVIAYDSVFNLDSTMRDSFLNILQRNKVKLYYEVKGKKRAVICRPKDVDSFVAMIREKCAEFHEETSGSRLDVFFDDDKKE